MAELNKSARNAAPFPTEPKESEAMVDFGHVWNEWTWQMQNLQAEDGIPGLALAMIENRTHPRFKCIGVRDNRTRQPVTEHTLFHIASTQKSMTALFIATLVDEGRFTWDTPVSEVAPQFRLGDDGATRTVTMRHLLSMCGGIPSSAQEDFDARATRAEDLFDYMPRIRPRTRPGQSFDYSNLSCAAAGYCGVIADGGAWGQLEVEFAGQIKRRILDPIGMTDATFSADQARASGDFAVSHAKGMLFGTNITDEVVAQPDPLSPAGSLRASIHDVARFLATLLNGGVTPEGNRVVSEANLRETWSSQIRSEQGDYGMGWEIEHDAGMSFLYHEGNYAGYLALLAMAPDLGTGIALLANMDNEDGFAGAALSQWLPLLGD
jgi:CubicO group peptidase (beta-lactamase class C family)